MAACDGPSLRGESVQGRALANGNEHAQNMSFRQTLKHSGFRPVLKYS